MPAYDIESPGIDNMSCHFDIMSPCKTSTMQTSKAFRCTLPMLRDDQLINLRRWAELHCAQSIVFRDDRGSAVFVGLQAQLRTAPASRALFVLLCAASASMCRYGGAGAPSSRPVRP